MPMSSMMSTPYGLELHCKFGSMLADIIIRSYNLRICYPNNDSILYTNDIKSCF